MPSESLSLYQLENDLVAFAQTDEGGIDPAHEEEFRVLVQIRRIEHREAKVFPLSLNVGAP
jgi:hypothetical protein